MAVMERETSKKTGTGVGTVADAIEQTLEWLDKQGCGEVGQERRGIRRSRYRVGAKVTYVAAGLGQAVTSEVMTRNLSRSGLSFLHPTLIYPGQRVNVRLPLPDRSVRHIGGKVVRVRPAVQGGGRGMYEIGVEFTEMEVAVGE
ncbi:MAG TPA: PilZ domain-containing protein [Phycisphaerae bacterium]|nr:PilZ domain-containing protein [Phycisphaerae bacterium]